MERISYFDFLRGVAIIFVVICHSYSGDPLAGTFKEDVYLLLRQLVTCAVPLFLAMSGFFMATKVLTTRKDYCNFVIKHSFRIWLPMVIWSLPLFVIKEHNNYITAMILLLLGGNSIYYFITLNIQYYAMQPLLKKTSMGGGVFLFNNHFNSCSTS